jgi:hypothetical protein
MARVVGADTSYEVARLFAERCLGNQLSLLWPNTHAWTVRNLTTLIDLIAPNLTNVPGSTFLAKLKDEIQDKPPELAMVVADTLVIYHLFDDWTKATTKRTQVDAVVNWASMSTFSTVDPAILDRAFLHPLGAVGTHYVANPQREFLFFLDFTRQVKQRSVSLEDEGACRRLADEVWRTHPQTGEARHIMLHLLFPDQYEPIATQSGKEQIVKSLSTVAGASASRDLDASLRLIRAHLTPRFGSSFNFYDAVVKPLWSGKASDALQSGFRETLQAYCQARESAQFSGTHPVFASFQRVTQLLSSSQPVKENPHLATRCSLGQGNWARVPWIAILDNRVTTTTQTGFYCVYLYREDCTGVYLTLIQGVTQPQKDFGAKLGKEKLRERAAVLRTQIPELTSAGFKLDDSIDLHASGALGNDYQVSTVAHKYYAANNLPNSTEMLSDLQALLAAYAKCVTATETPVAPVDLATLHNEFSDSLVVAGLLFGARHSQIVRAFLASLLTKRFVILTGLSGSGKTQIALKLGEWLGGDKCVVIPVRPDWTGPEPLFGYEDVLSLPAAGGRRAWNVPAPLEFMLKAARDPSRPYLLILDEMNLAHVERYFADFLSGMESGKPVLPNLIVDDDGAWRVTADDPQPIPIPTNLFVVGTVNVDETTYLFSPKVLDRANTIEFRVDTIDLSPSARKPQPLAAASPSVAQALQTAASDDNWHLDHPAPQSTAFIEALIRLHRLLTRHHAEFGHRTFYEAIRFSAVFAALGDPAWEHALDLQVFQKVLPRMHGSRRKLEPLLQAVGAFCLAPDTVDPDQDPAATFDLMKVGQVPRLPASFAKVQRMTQAARADQFASFAE